MFGFELAYIDPGSGSLIIQGAIATIVAAAVFFRGHIARLFPGRRDHDEPTPRPRRPRVDHPSIAVDDAARGG